MYWSGDGKSGNNACIISGGTGDAQILSRQDTTCPHSAIYDINEVAM
jgi:hypothetical protein